MEIIRWNRKWEENIIFLDREENEENFILNNLSKTLFFELYLRYINNEGTNVVIFEFIYKYKNIFKKIQKYFQKNTKIFSKKYKNNYFYF
jgi:hypothetical protein